jgi:GT2 family glycosyltransferase
MRDDFTFMIKTLERPACLHNLLNSMREHGYQDTAVVIADDSREPLREIEDRYPNVQYLWYGHDHGIGACYNDLLAHWITTPVTVLLDDDFVFTNRTLIEKMVVYIRGGIFDIAGGDVYCHKRKKFQHFIGHFSYPEPHTLHVEELGKLCPPPISVDITMNFFAANTAALRTVGWDEDLKVSRHLDFFLRAARAKIRVGYVGGCCVDHKSIDNGTYRQYRWHRMHEYQQMFLDKWNLNRVTGLGEIERM